MLIIRLIFISTLATLLGCNKSDSFNLSKIEYRQECFGDASVKCRSMLVDLNVVKLEAAIEAMEREKNNIVSCRDQQYYDSGISLIHDRIEYFKDLKPNIFMRLFLSSMDVEFNPPPYRSEAEYEAFLASAGNCNRQKPDSVSNSASANAHVNDALDSNGEHPKSLSTVAGQLSRKEMPNGQSALILNDLPLFSGDDANWQFPLQVFKLSGGREAILIASSGGRGNSCETMFFFLMADQTGVKPTPEFGTCSPQGKIRQNGDLVMLMLPKMGGNSLYVLDGTTLSEDGNPIAMTASNNPAN
jgi:hypothetical protein